MDGMMPEWKKNIQPTYTKCIRCEQGYVHLWHDDGTKASETPPEWRRKDDETRP